MTLSGASSSGPAGSAPPTDDDAPPGRGRFRWPVTRPVERVAGAADERSGGPGRALLLFTLVGYASLVVILAVAGWLIVHTGAGDPVRRWDATITRDLADGRSSVWNDYTGVSSSAADALPIITGAFVVTLTLAALRRWGDLMFIPFAVGLEVAVFLTVAFVVGRARPSVDRLGPVPGTQAFPSGHVAATIVLCGGILILLGVGRWRVPSLILGWLAVGVAVVSVGFSRVYRGMHSPTDVAAGAFLGVAALLVAMAATRATGLGLRRRHGDSTP